LNPDRQRPPCGSVQPVLSASAETALGDGEAPRAALSDKTLCVHPPSGPVLAFNPGRFSNEVAPRATFRRRGRTICKLLPVRPLGRKETPQQSLTAWGWPWSDSKERDRLGAGVGSGGGAWHARCQRSGKPHDGKLCQLGGRQSGLPRSGNCEAGRRGAAQAGLLRSGGCGASASPDRKRGRECRGDFPRSGNPRGQNYRALISGGARASMALGLQSF